ncbi:MAG: prepilin-type N-terminal cleavage/methylation domain-containing protein [Gammaproteobacteria bacterium]|nr:MAG: prepilin-type N-terminal cleavage/methylation domain-containing protein [Gammaproteobacteria bacterium]
MKTRGFTLIELMITVAVVAVIASIAYPSYQEQIRKTRRSDAKAALMDAAAIMERHYTQFGQYGGGAVVPATSPEQFYTIAVTGTIVGAQVFTITATRAGQQTNDKCGNFTIDQTQAKAVASGSLTAAECGWD